VARVLEASLEAPFVGEQGLGSDNVPGLPRLRKARFTGEYPLARIDFEDRALPVDVSLEAFSPFIPHDAEDSGLPVAILRYRVKNPTAGQATVSIGFAIENPIVDEEAEGQEDVAHEKSGVKRLTEYREADGLAGLLMSNPGLPEDHPMRGDFLLSAIHSHGSSANESDSKLTYWRGWPRSRWWNSPMLFWDDFSDDGLLSTTEPDPRNAVGSLCQQHVIPAGHSAESPSCWPGAFPTVRRRGAVGRRRKVTRKR
jgi:non-lysosomal glucosylceramidase